MMRYSTAHVSWGAEKRYKTESPTAMSDVSQALLVVAFGLVIMCGLAYAAEMNALMSKERLIRIDEQKIQEVREETVGLQTQAIRLASHENLNAVALSDSLVIAHDVAYLVVGDSSVALAK